MTMRETDLPNIQSAKSRGTMEPSTVKGVHAECDALRYGFPYAVKRSVFVNLPTILIETH